MIQDQRRITHAHKQQKNLVLEIITYQKQYDIATKIVGDESIAVHFIQEKNESLSNCLQFQNKLKKRVR